MPVQPVMNPCEESGILADDLPQGLADIAEQIGLTGALTLAEAWGGIRHYYPRPENLTPDHPLVEMLGRARAERLCALIGGGDVIIPRAVGPLRAARDRAIREARGKESARMLANRFQLSERRVWEILSAVDDSAAAEAAGQMRLF